MLVQNAARNRWITKEENYSNDTEYWWSISRHWIVNIVMSQLKDNSEDILDMNDVNIAYKNYERDNCKRYLKQLITENVPGVIFIRPPACN